MNEPVYLRALEASDLERCHKWHNDKTLFATLGGTFHFASKQAVEEWLKRKTSYSSSQDEINLAVCVKDTDKHVGNIYLRQIDWINRRAEIHIFMGDPEDRSKGYGRPASRLLLSYAFNDLGLKKIFIYQLSDNVASINIAKKFGFQVEGTLKNYIFKNGVWKDAVISGLCAEDFINFQKEAPAKCQVEASSQLASEGGGLSYPLVTRDVEIPLEHQVV